MTNLFKNISNPKLAIIILVVSLLLAYIFALPRNLFDVPYSTPLTKKQTPFLFGIFETKLQDNCLFSNFFVSLSLNINYKQKFAYDDFAQLVPMYRDKSR